MLAVGNGRFAGGGYAVAPQARRKVGLLDLVLVPSVPFGDLPQLVGELFDVAAAENQHVLFRQLAQFALHFTADFQVKLDGEPAVGRTFRFRVLPSGCRFWPRRSPQMPAKRRTRTKPPAQCKAPSGS